MEVRAVGGEKISLWEQSHMHYIIGGRKLCTFCRRRRCCCCCCWSAAVMRALRLSLAFVLPSESFSVSLGPVTQYNVLCAKYSDSINYHCTCHMRNNTECPFYRVPEHSNFITRKAYIRHVSTWQPPLSVTVNRYTLHFKLSGAFTNVSCTLWLGFNWLRTEPSSRLLWTR